MAHTPFFIFIRNKKGILLNTEVKSVSSYNSIGKFDILSTHIQFISVIEGSVKVVYPDDRMDEIPVGTGVLKVLENKVTVYLADK